MGADVCQGAQSCLLSPRGWGTAPLPSPRSLNHWVTVQKKRTKNQPAPGHTYKMEILGRPMGWGQWPCPSPA